jgi:DNA-binding HxlR family transcriptional regulator
VAPRITDCPLARAVERIGEWPTMELLHEALDGCSRFSDFQVHLQTETDVLRSRLYKLVDSGLMTLRGDDEYVPTELGRSLRPVIIMLAAWGNHQLRPPERSMILVDAATGVEVEPVVVDRDTGLRVDTGDFVFTAGPGASKAMRTRYALGAAVCE